MKTKLFGYTKSKAPIQRYSISGGGLNAKFINWGAVLQDLRFEGESKSLVFGLNNLEDYLQHSRYFGATAGPYANRIDTGQFQINEQEVQLQTHFQNQHHLHAGTEGIGKRAWKLEGFEKDSLKLSIIHPDTYMEFPAPMKINARFTLSDPGILDIVYSAETEIPTIANLAHHSYFNLSGEKTILDHELLVNASTYLEVDSGLISRGAPESVEDGVHDFQDFIPIQNVSTKPSKLDHNFCLSLKQKVEKMKKKK